MSTAQVASTSCGSGQLESAGGRGATGAGLLRTAGPFSGWVLKRSVDVGTLVGPATNGFTLADTRSVKAVFGVPDTAMANVKLGSAQSVTTEALPGSFSGHITSISAAADPKSRVYSVEVRIDNPRNELKAGMIASIILAGGKPNRKGNGRSAHGSDSQPGQERRLRGVSDRGKRRHAKRPGTGRDARQYIRKQHRGAERPECR